MMKATRIAITATLWAGSTGIVHAAVAVSDCPIGQLPYSLDTSVADIRADPAAMSVVQQQAPALAPIVRGLPQGLNSIISLQQASGMGGGTVDTKVLATELAKVPVSAVAITNRCARYDNDRPVLPAKIARPAVLVFDKINGFRDSPSVDAARTALNEMAKRKGWVIVFSDKGGVINPHDLARFDAVIWNNVSGDALTLTQRQALKSYVERGGGFAAMHGSGGDPTYYWPWYADTLIGARFIGHPYQPQFQTARVIVEKPLGSITRGLPGTWTMSEEWYSFAKSPRARGAHVLATLDESSYRPVAFGGADIRMGGDHPIAWTRCVGYGRSFYTAIGHRPESYGEPNSLKLLEQGIVWAMGRGDTSCAGGREVAAKK